MDNCSADFSFVCSGDEMSEATHPASSHELLHPLYKELIQLCDVAGKDKAAKTARDLESLIIALKEEIASEQSPPTGKRTEAVVALNPHSQLLEINLTSATNFPIKSIMETAYMGAGTEVDKGENARLSSLIGAMAIADLVKTTLGPKGMDKILQAVDPNDQSISVTNDGATILSKIPLDNAAAKVLVDMAKVQDKEVGDGTTSVAVLCGELLREAEQLLLQQRIHPQTICAGWRLATKVAKVALDQCATEGVTDDDLFKIASTTLSSKLVNAEKEHFARLCVSAVQRLKGSGNLDHIQIIKLPGGSLRDSYLEEGFLLQKSIGVGQPKRMENCKILLANTSMDTDKIKIYGSRVQVDSLNKVAEIEQAEKLKMKRKVDKILAHGCNVFINRQLIYNFPESLFTASKVMAIEHADFDGIERLAAVTGGEVVSTFDNPDKVQLGQCDVLEEVVIGETKVLRFGGSTLKYPRRIYGGGCTEVAMAEAIDKAAKETPGKQALAMSSFSKALLQLPMIVADNGGYDAADLVTKLRAAHAAGKSSCGLNMSNGTIGDMAELGVMESYRSKLQVVTSASEAAEMILRVDDIIKAAPRRREEMM
ncbi:chaperonin GroEL [Nitzschia inconspicua]|uniref:CCT-beta n=1 Tax=Nitzschia inconspicua TaxID=303405 RepID=A0A9K3K5D2_9STRA|nr:chaperonin GroEL [Nitzschia inconspicua]